MPALFARILKSFLVFSLCCFFTHVISKLEDQNPLADWNDSRLPISNFSAKTQQKVMSAAATGLSPTTTSSWAKKRWIGNGLGNANLADLSPEMFSNNSETNVTVQVGQAAVLPCPVRSHQAYTVTWIRRRDFYILTSEKSTYTSDERFSVLHEEDVDKWALRIATTLPKDTGRYECQVSTGDGLMSHFVYLQVMIPRAWLLDQTDIHVPIGGKIKIVCIIEKTLVPPKHVHWYHDGKEITFADAEYLPRIRMKLDPGLRTHSTLIVEDARSSDSGNYTCITPFVNSIGTYVLVEDDKMRAIHQMTDGASAIRAPLAAALSAFQAAFWLSRYLCSWSMHPLIPNLQYTSWSVSPTGTGSWRIT